MDDGLGRRPVDDAVREPNGPPLVPDLPRAEGRLTVPQVALDDAERCREEVDAVLDQDRRLRARRASGLPALALSVPLAIGVRVSASPPAEPVDGRLAQGPADSTPPPGAVTVRPEGT